MEFAAEYAPQNFYCFSIEKKSPPSLLKKFNDLAKCFPENIFIIELNFSINSAGYNMNFAHFECFKKLRENKWKYVFNLQVC